MREPCAMWNTTAQPTRPQRSGRLCHRTGLRGCLKSKTATTATSVDPIGLETGCGPHSDDVAVPHSHQLDLECTMRRHAPALSMSATTDSCAKRSGFQQFPHILPVTDTVPHLNGMF